MSARLKKAKEAKEYSSLNKTTEKLISHSQNDHLLPELEAIANQSLQNAPKRKFESPSMASINWDSDSDVSGSESCPQSTKMTKSDEIEYMNIFNAFKQPYSREIHRINRENVKKLDIRTLYKVVYMHSDKKVSDQALEYIRETRSKNPWMPMLEDVNDALTYFGCNELVFLHYPEIFPNMNQGIGDNITSKDIILQNYLNWVVSIGLLLPQDEFFSEDIVKSIQQSLYSILILQFDQMASLFFHITKSTINSLVCLMVDNNLEDKLIHIFKNIISNQEFKLQLLYNLGERLFNSRIKSKHIVLFYYLEFYHRSMSISYDPDYSSLTGTDCSKAVAKNILVQILKVLEKIKEHISDINYIETYFLNIYLSINSIIYCYWISMDIEITDSTSSADKENVLSFKSKWKDIYTKSSYILSRIKKQKIDFDIIVKIEDSVLSIQYCIDNSYI